jgi:hypothetical protein
MDRTATPISQRKSIKMDSEKAKMISGKPYNE